MRIARLAAAVLLFPALALAQDKPVASPVGTLLHDALPPGADLVIHAPSLPRLLKSAVAAGFGTADGWGDAFRDQLTRWGQATGGPERLVKAGEALLAKADGEALLAGIELPRLGSPTAPRTRCTLLAFRTTAKEAELQALVDEVIAAGLRARWNGTRQLDRGMGRTLISLPGVFDGLWIRVEDHMVAASDHPYALGLLFRGLNRLAQQPQPPEDVSSIPLRVRRGRRDSPERWEGMTFLQREGLSAPATRRPMAAAAMPDASAVASLAVAQPFDFPLFPVRVPEDAIDRGARMSACPLAMSLLADGTFDVRGTAAPSAGADARPVVGMAARLGWLRAFAGGHVPLPSPAFDREPLARAFVAAEVSAPADAPAAYEWRPTEQEGELRGPAWHGPVTFLALRNLRDIAHGLAPYAPPPPPPPAEPGSTEAGGGAPRGPGVPEETRLPHEPPPKPFGPLPAPGTK